MRHRSATAQIDLAALRHNFSRVKAYAGNSRVFCVLKSDAYGHGAVACAKALQADADGFAVVCLREAMALRDAGVTRPLLVLQGFNHDAEIPLIATHQIQVSIHADWQVALLETTAFTGAIDVWIKMDTGMGRLGFLPEEVASIYRRLAACRRVKRILGFMTHMASADEHRSDVTTQQMARYWQGVGDLPGEHCIANSAAIVAWPETHQDWVRPGIMLYGGVPMAEPAAFDLDLQPVMTLQTRLMTVRQMPQGARIGYSGTYTCPEAMPIGLVAIGYGDGYPRHARTGTPVLVSRQRTQLIGRVSMDSFAVDLRGIECQVGDKVVLWGRGLPIEEVAECCETISYELLCHVCCPLRYVD